MHASHSPRSLVSTDPTVGPDHFFGAPCCCSFSSCSSFILSISSSCALENLGYSNAIWKRMPHGDVPAGYFAFPKNCTWRLVGWKPIFMILPKPPPKGSVKSLPLLALQLAVMMGAVVTYQPPFML